MFVHLRQKARLTPEISPKFLSTLGPNPVQTRSEKPGPTYNSAFNDNLHKILVWYTSQWQLWKLWLVGIIMGSEA